MTHSFKHVNLSLEGRVARKPVNANPGLKVNRIIRFFSNKRHTMQPEGMFLLAGACKIGIYL